MSGVEIALPVIEGTAALIKLVATLADVELSADGIAQDAQACRDLATQIRHDIHHAEYLEKALMESASILKHDRLGGWIHITIRNTKKAMGKFDSHIPEDDNYATLNALTRKMQRQRKWEEPERTLRTCHSSLLTAIGIMYQLSLAMGLNARWAKQVEKHSVSVDY
ncbi:hypothetical protein FBEOM_1678 [Fusarium beomiforme]|uniref:Uncharacterized protein n=1 Tax=Fusarium beomiforme TaxID=44412 RepID=A0A9P5AT57_9HYPO|nr:hypothetical protein FBEOM_1678 [Fusarium beomiforme]